MNASSVKPALSALALQAVAQPILRLKFLLSQHLKRKSASGPVRSGRHRPGRSYAIPSPRVRRMRHELSELLDRYPPSRLALRHLAHLELALQRGDAAFGMLSAGALDQALTQLESLVTDWTPPGISGLRARLVVAIMGRESVGPDASGFRALSQFYEEKGLEVEEVSDSVFMEIDESWTRTAAKAAQSASA
jgi:hypothetical protein